MKRSASWIMGLVLVTISIIAPASTESAPKDPLLYVQVRNTNLRAKPEFWAPSLAPLTYGASVVPVAAAPTDKSWLKAKLGEQEGYVHVSAVTKRRIILNGAAVPKDKGVDQSSIVLAGKGFNSQIENKYGAANGLDYAAVNSVEQLRVDAGTEAAFISDGKLKG